MTNIKKSLGKKIKYYREQKNITQEHLAELIGINSRSVSLIECGQNFVTADTLTNVSRALGVSFKKLFDFEDENIQDENIKKELINLINKNEDKISRIYKIVKAYLD